MEDIIEPEKPDQEIVIPEDEELIELTDVIEGPAKSEEETIELTDVIEDSAESEEEIVELTLTEDERKDLVKSAEAIRKSIQKL